MGKGILSSIRKKPRYIVKDNHDGTHNLTFNEDDLLDLLNRMPAPGPDSLVWFEGDWRPLKEVRRIIA